MFDEFFIDLTDIGAGSKEKLDKIILIQEFENAIIGQDKSKEVIKKMVSVSTNNQYQQGL